MSILRLSYHAFRVSALAFVLGTSTVALVGLGLPSDGVAWAQQGGQGGGQGGQVAGGGQGGPGEDSEGRGPQTGTPSGGGRPVWAGEGIPEVELGRLNVARSPDQVLDRALAEALASWSPEMAAFYSLTLNQMIEQLSLNWDNLTIYDSPLQNLALMKDILADEVSQLPISNSNFTLMAVFLGVASDKTVPISTNTVIAVTTILGYPVSPIYAAELATAAEAVRIAVLAGHG